MRNCNKNVNITLHEIIDEIQLGESTVEIRNAIEIIKFILGFIPVINCITDEYYGTAEPPVRCGESHLSGLTEPLHFVY